MSYQDIIHAWKSDPEDRNVNLPDSPVGEELTDEDLAMIQGADSNCSACSNCSNCCSCCCENTYSDARWAPVQSIAQRSFAPTYKAAF